MRFAFERLFCAQRRRKMAFWAACVMICLVIFNASCSESDSRYTANTPVGAAPPRTALPLPPTSPQASANQQSFTLLDNRRMRLSDYTGKIVVLDFWATYCPPCVAEAPHLVEWQRRYGSQGLQIIGLNVGGADDRSKVPDFIETHKIQYALGYPDDAMQDLYMSGDDSIPQTIVFDREGRIVKHFVGFDSTVQQELESAIQTALAAKTN